MPPDVISRVDARRPSAGTIAAVAPMASKLPMARSLCGDAIAWSVWSSGSVLGSAMQGTATSANETLTVSFRRDARSRAGGAEAMGAPMASGLWRERLRIMLRRGHPAWVRGAKHPPQPPADKPFALLFQQPIWPRLRYAYVAWLDCSISCAEWFAHSMACLTVAAHTMPTAATKRQGVSWPLVILGLLSRPRRARGAASASPASRSLGSA
jgi:hypothetical protein